MPMPSASRWSETWDGLGLLGETSVVPSEAEGPLFRGGSYAFALSKQRNQFSPQIFARSAGLATTFFSAARISP